VRDIFSFGEERPDFPVRVVNEREARAAAGIMFAAASFGMFHACILGDFSYMKIIVVGFLMDFAIRVFINPKLAPLMIAARLAVEDQSPEWVGAPQKRFAWGLGFVMVFAMFWTLVVFNLQGPVNPIVCMICLLLLFYESSFGVCVGCGLYNMFHKEKAQFCPGGVCEVKPAAKAAKAADYAIMAVFGVFLFGLANFVL